MRILILIFISTLITSCATETEKNTQDAGFSASKVQATDNKTGLGSTYQGIDMTNVTESIRKNDQSEYGSEKEQELANQKEQEKEKVAEAQKTNAEYKEALRTNKCEKKFWSRYEYASYFQSLATRNKLTPYDVVLGSAYVRRNISQIVWYEAFDNYTKYSAYHFPYAINKKFDQEFPNEQEKKKNEKSVFNLQVKRDYECYIKLK